MFEPTYLDSILEGGLEIHNENNPLLSVSIVKALKDLLDYNCLSQETDEADLYKFQVHAHFKN